MNAQSSSGKSGLAMISTSRRRPAAVTRLIQSPKRGAYIGPKIGFVKRSKMSDARYRIPQKAYGNPKPLI
jgi:hypothetical protein